MLITGHQLIVELDPSDTATVVADAVRIERVSIETSALTAAVGAGATTLNVVDATAFPAPNFMLTTWYGNGHSQCRGYCQQSVDDQCHGGSTFGG